MQTYGTHQGGNGIAIPKVFHWRQVLNSPNRKRWLTISFLIYFFTLGIPTLQSQVVINEVLPNGTVELKNLGSSTVDVSTYWLCDFPIYEQIQNSNIICGSMMLGPGEILAVDDFNTINNNDGEMGLYTSSSFSSSAAIIDYVEWGFSGHGRSGVAVNAGIWTTGDFVPAFGATESIEYSGTGNSSSDWTATATTSICMENGGTNVCMADGGGITLSNGDIQTSICVDGVPDPLNVVFSTNPTGASTGWIITDDVNNILALPGNPPFDLDGAGVGNCIIWHVAYEPGTGFGGNIVGNNLSDLTGCFDLSNGITVIREAADGGTVSLTNGNTTYTGTAGNIVFDVQHTTSAPNLSYWYVVTDENDNILDWLNSANGNTLDLSGAPVGECHVWGWSYRGLPNPVVGDPISSLTDDPCESISSNFITVTRNAPTTGCNVFVNDITLSNGSISTSICVDGNADPLGVITNGGTPNVSTGWIITDDIGNILALPQSPPFDLDGAGVGVCQIWYIRYTAGFGGNIVGNNLTDLTGCFALSNPLEVIREAADGGTVSLDDGTNSTSICIDGIADPLVVVHQNSSPNLTYRYVITDDSPSNTILAISNSNSIDLDGAGIGTCRIWGWSYRGLNQNDFIGLPLADLQAADCSDISTNFVEVIREAADGGTVSLDDGTNSTSICVDGIADPLVVVHQNSSPNLTYRYVITDDSPSNTILAISNSNSIDLDGAGVGTCRIWGWSYRGLNQNDFIGLPLADLQAADCSDISTNFVEVIREAADGGTVSLADGSTSTSICVDGIADPLVVVHQNSSPNLTYRYVITDDSPSNTILAISNSNSIDLDGAGVGTCRIWGWSYRGLNQNDFIGLPLADLQAADCSDISDNFVEVIREAADGGTVSLDDGTNSTSICVDGIADPIVVVHQNSSPNLTYRYVITDDSPSNTILAISNSNSIDLDGAGVGTCRIWGWSYRGLNQNDFIGLPLADLQAADCSDISDNFVEVIREAADGGTVSLDDGTNSTSICVDGIADPIVVVHQNSSPNLTYRYVITDDSPSNTILAISNSNSIDLDGAGVGTCRIWGWSYRGLNQNDFIGLPLADLQAADCSDISDNFVEVIREEPDGGAVVFANGTIELTVPVGDVFVDIEHFTDAANLSYWYIVTDINDNIVSFSNSNAGIPVDLSSPTPVVYRIWGWSYRGLPNPVVGEHISTLNDDPCEEISTNFITVNIENGAPVPSNAEFVATLSGTQEVPSALTSAYGSIQADLNGNVLTITGSFNGLIGDFDVNIAGGAHVHRAIAGRNGGVELLLTTNISNNLRSGIFEAADNTFTLTTEQLAALNARELYINIHTTAFPGGELRGQLLANSDEYLQAVLLGSNEIPSVNTDAYGNLLFELEDNQLTISGSFDDLSGNVAIALAGGAHVHDAPNGRNGGVVFPLNLTIDADNQGAIVEANNNIFTLTSEQVDKLTQDGYYINVHSEAIMSGELRGQISTLSSAVFRAQLTGTQEVPAVNTNADGRLLLNYDGQGNISVSGTFNNLSNALNLPLAGGIHIHTGQAGRNGGIAFILEPELSLDSKSAVIRPEDNTFSISPTQLNTLFERGFYVNVHSFNHPGGELRGQLLPLAKTYLGTSLSGLNEVPSVLTPAGGNVQLEITGDQLVVTGGFTELTGDFAADIAGGSHLHLSDATGNGDVIILLNATTDLDLRGAVYTPQDNTFTLTAEQKDYLLNGNVYVNIHSQAVPSGELRGQILRDDNAFPDSGFDIISPADNAQVVIDGAISTPFEVLWEDTTDPNDDLVVYTWQLATDNDFSNVLISSKVGTNLSFTTTSDVVNDLLINAGVPVGQDISLYHRVLASDGSVSTNSAAVKVQITRAGDACAAPESIPGFTTIGDFGDSRYYLSNNVSEPLNAQLTAESFGGFLATIGSQGENDFIQQHVPELTYIGLNDVDDEGNFVWFNGEPVTFNNIDPCDICEPNSDIQDFVVIAPWNGSWSFSNTFNQRRFVMEIPCATSSTANSSAVARAKMEEVLAKSEDLMMDKLMPNPARDYINAVILSKMEQDVELRIYDSRGTLIQTESTFLVEGANSVELNINDLAAGFYYIQIPQKSGKAANLRFVKVSE